MLQKFSKLVTFVWIFLAVSLPMSLLTGCGDDNDSSDDPQVSYSESEFVGYWIDSREKTAFRFQSNGDVTAYSLKDRGSNVYTDTYSGSWYYNQANNQLNIRWASSYPNSDLTSSGKTNEFTVVSLAPSIMKLRDSFGGTVTLEAFTSNLSLAENEEDPTPSKPGNSSCDDERIYGTWKGSMDGDIFTVTFDERGILKEEWSNGYDSQSNTSEYTFKNGKLSFDEDPVFANSIGNPPFTVTFSVGSRPTRMTITDPTLYSITFTRQ